MFNRVTALLVLLFIVTTPAAAQSKDTFCNGFSEGFKAIKGNLVIVPICPIAPITPIGSTPYREGLKAGMDEGRKSGSAVVGGSAPQSSATFCDGYSEGWKAVKGELVIVPICPIPPITPIGSTPYREGLNAGMAKARAG